jgi:hypothetical protein
MGRCSFLIAGFRGKGQIQTETNSFLLWKRPLTSSGESEADGWNGTQEGVQFSRLTDISGIYPTNDVLPDPFCSLEEKTTKKKRKKSTLQILSTFCFTGGMEWQIRLLHSSHPIRFSIQFSSSGEQVAPIRFAHLKNGASFSVGVAPLRRILLYRRLKFCRYSLVASRLLSFSSRLSVTL